MMVLCADSEEYESVTVDGIHAPDMNTAEPEPFEENEDPEFPMSVSLSSTT